MSRWPRNSANALHLPTLVIASLLTLLILVSASEAATTTKSPRQFVSPYDRCMLRCYRWFANCYKRATNMELMTKCVHNYNNCFPPCYELA